MVLKEKMMILKLVEISYLKISKRKMNKIGQHYYKWKLNSIILVFKMFMIKMILQKIWKKLMKMMKTKKKMINKNIKMSHNNNKSKSLKIKIQKNKVYMMKY